MLKKYIIPILIGCLAGTITLWAFDSFAIEDAEYFAKAFLKCLIPVCIAVAIVNSRREQYL